MHIEPLDPDIDIYTNDIQLEMIINAVNKIIGYVNQKEEDNSIIMGTGCATGPDKESDHG